MYKLNKTFIFPCIALIILTYGLSNQFFGVPPVGKLLDPFIGAIQNKHERLNNDLLIAAHLPDSVQVFFDERAVPHIYAKNTTDLYFAQGYVAASLRLWQMDFTSYVTAGRLAEIIDNKDLVNYDRNQRRLGLLEAAKNALALIEKDRETISALTAYTSGVNAYISQLTYKTIPFEYKLLDYFPEKWSNLKSILILKAMGNTLSGYEEDMAMSRLVLALGEQKFNALFPDYQHHSPPVISEHKPAPDAATPLSTPSYLNYAFMTSTNVIPASAYNPKLGSNSWAVSGSKSRSGYPILANDLHLNLTLPCIWLEMQLSCQGMNVYGVTVPGAPAIIIGLNENIAWGITNGADDVKDWYKLKITDDYRKYEMNGKWMNLNSRVEYIKYRNHKPVLDTIYSSKHGPIISTKNFPGPNPDLLNYALKWELLNASNEFSTFIQLNKAKNYQDFRSAIENYSCPAMNFTFASKDDTIAINHQGKMAIKTRGQGKFVLDGTDSSLIYTKYIPFDSLPHMVNPATHFVLSANQRPTWSSYPFYYNGYYSENRAARINELLEQPARFDVGQFQQMQLDNTNYFAQQAIPVFTASTDRAKLNKEQTAQLNSLLSWKGNYDSDNQQARLFELWLTNSRKFTWDELTGLSIGVTAPSDYTLLEFIQNDPLNPIFDMQGTVNKETAKDIITNAFIRSCNEYEKESSTKGNTWGSSNKVNISHLTNIAAFGVSNISSSGNPETINALSSNWGPTWRMIVAFGEKTTAYGIYPGGQSGNIGSAHYDDFIADWTKGKYYTLHFYLSQTEATNNARFRWVLK